MTPSHALLFMLIVPAVFALTYARIFFVCRNFYHFQVLAHAAVATDCSSCRSVEAGNLLDPQRRSLRRITVDINCFCAGVRRPFDAISPASSTEDLYRPLMAEEALAPSPVREDVDEDSRHRRISNVHLALSAKIRLIKVSPQRSPCHF